MRIRVNISIFKTMLLKLSEEIDHFCAKIIDVGQQLLAESYGFVTVTIKFYFTSVLLYSRRPVEKAFHTVS